MRSFLRATVVAAIVVLARGASGDELELLNGTRVSGEVVSEAAEAVVMKVTAGQSAAEMKFPLSKVHAITIEGKRRVVNEKPAGKPTQKPPSREGEASPPAEPSTDPAKPAAKTRIKAEVQTLIKQAGTTPPDWWDSVPLEYPQTLDLSWPEKAPGPWNPQKNVGQYIWSIINENPSKWKSGVKFLHHLLSVDKDSPSALTRVMEALANAYFNLLHDWARAAYWFEKADDRDSLTVFDTVRLGECYWRLGNKAMAVEQLNALESYMSPAMVKLWSEMGEIEKALALADAMIKQGQRGEAWLAADGYLAAADTCRLHGRYKQALACYEKVLTLPAAGKSKGWIERAHKRAQASIEGIKAFDALDLKRIANGTYTASSTAYAGPLQVAVTVQDGRIESVKVTRHEDKQYYGALAETPKQIVEKQSVRGIDAVTCATITSEAIVNATAKALAGAMK